MKGGVESNGERRFGPSAGISPGGGYDPRLDRRGKPPRFIHSADGMLGPGPVLNVLGGKAGAIYGMDRGYLDCARLLSVGHQPHAFFVTRVKSNLQLWRVYSASGDRGTSSLCDQTVALTGPTGRTDYPEHLRRSRFQDPEAGTTRVFRTTNFTVPAAPSAHAPRVAGRGTCSSSGSNSICVARSSTATRRKRCHRHAGSPCQARSSSPRVKLCLHLDVSRYTLRPIVSVTLFEKLPVPQAVPGRDHHSEQNNDCNQPPLFARSPGTTDLRYQSRCDCGGNPVIITERFLRQQAISIVAP